MTTKDLEKYLKSFEGLFTTANSAREYPRSWGRYVAKRVEDKARKEKKFLVTELEYIARALNEINALFSPDEHAADFGGPLNAEAVVEKARKYVDDHSRKIAGELHPDCGKSAEYAARFRRGILPKCNGGDGCAMCWAIYIVNRNKDRHEEKRVVI